MSFFTKVQPPITRFRILGPPRELSPEVKDAASRRIQALLKEHDSLKSKLKVHAAFFLIAATGGLFLIPLGTALYFKNKKICVQKGRPFIFSHFIKELFTPTKLRNEIIWLYNKKAKAIELEASKWLCHLKS